MSGTANRQTERTGAMNFKAPIKRMPKDYFNIKLGILHEKTTKIWNFFKKRKGKAYAGKKGGGAG